MSIKLILVILCLVCFGLRFCGVNTGRLDMMAGGFMFAAAAVFLA